MQSYNTQVVQSLSIPKSAIENVLCFTNRIPCSSVFFDSHIYNDICHNIRKKEKSLAKTNPKTQKLNKDYTTPLTNVHIIMSQRFNNIILGYFTIY